MKVEKVFINLSGRYNINNLEQIGYRRESNSRGWYFDGVLHRYIFEPLDIDKILIIIEKKHKSVELPHAITFGNIGDWVKKSVDVIEAE